MNFHPPGFRAAALLSVIALGLTAYPASPATANSGIRPAAISNCNGNYPASYAQFWHSWPWTFTGAKSKEYRTKNPDGTRWVWIWGGGTYKNNSSPKLPKLDGSDQYNEYDTQYLSEPGLNRGPGRFVREKRYHKLYYSSNHYQGGGWCYVGTQY